jgi:hypothetical protein
MIVMLYAHVEGFSKVALSTYVQAINRAAPSHKDVADCIAAASFDEVFHALEFGDEKCKVFSTPPPTDKKLLRFARQRDFFAEFSGLTIKPIAVPETVVNTEDNLGATVLRRNLFRLGLPVNLLQHHEPNLDELKNRRNNIAHGSDDSLVRDVDYERLRRSAFELMDELTLAIVGAVEHQQFLRAGNAA